MTSQARTPWKHALLLVAVGVVTALLLIEVAVRVAKHSLFTWQGNDEDCCTLDPMVGYVISKEGAGYPGYAVTVGKHGTRLNGDTPPHAERPLMLAVGDSFAFGDGVDDRDTWPAALEQVTGQRVINAGMIAFGLDQAVLRAEQLDQAYTPDTVILGFIPHDVLRCEMSYWSGFPKPYFDVDTGGLRLHPATIPTPPAFARLRRLLSWSMALDSLFPRFLHWKGPQAEVVHRQGTQVACLLMERLAALGRARNARIVVVAYPQQLTPTPEHLEIKTAVLACAQANHLLALDLFPVFERLPPEPRARLFNRHFTAEGNRLVATEIATFLEHSPPMR